MSVYTMRVLKFANARSHSQAAGSDKVGKCPAVPGGGGVVGFD